MPVRSGRSGDGVCAPGVSTSVRPALCEVACQPRATAVCCGAITTSRPRTTCAARRGPIDIKAGKVQIVVVYKVDRLTRALADFAKIVDVLDTNEASFVSVTQSFDTTTSMRRLPRNDGGTDQYGRAS